ncbi:hypothetical protein PIB30_034552 [Stylosanthes scabra]|uniref:WD repeat-containing protein 76 n=1 Tax=Stylosanthes scabra TaxID=79078 RepID=A0ABU6TCJ4_9FABA|nr:hypothetical protein [Stylosanthes scabra]
MAPQKLNDYERRRLDNIRRNDEMMAALKLHSKAASLLFKRPSVVLKSEKKLKTKTTPVVIRRSLRTRGIQPDSKGLEPKQHSKNSIPLPRKSLPMNAAYSGEHSDASFVEAMLAAVAKQETTRAMGGEGFDGSKDGKRDKVRVSFELGSMKLDPKNTAKVVPERITTVRFIPSSTLRMVVVGSQIGNIGFWNVGADGNQVYSYCPHPARITGILVQPNSLPKIYTSCYDGSVWLMDAEKETLNLVYCSNKYIYSFHQPKNEANNLFVGDGQGGLTVWDCRMGKCSSKWDLHEDRINTIDFNSENPHIVATSSNDGTVCTWDMRYADADNITALKTLTYKMAMQSAYFSPSGCKLATTSTDNLIGIYGGVNLEDAATIYDNKGTNCGNFRAIWGWDDTYVFGGNKKREVVVVSAVERKIVMTLKSPHLSANLQRFDVHPYEVGTLAGTTGRGKVFVWTSC